MNFENQTLLIPGLEKTYRFMQISDCHIYVNSDENDETDYIFTEERIRDHAWQATDKTPAEMLCEALDDADREKVDAVIVAGDAVDYHSPANISFLRKEFSARTSEILYVYGNHEGSKHKKKVEPRDLYPDYDGLMPGSPDFWVRDYGELLIVGMDDSDHKLTEAQVTKLREQCARNIPILLVVHTPIAAEDVRPSVIKAWGSGADWFMLGYAPERTEGYTKEFYELVMSPDTPIKAVLAGHDHFSYSGPLPGGRMQYISAPSFTGYARMLTVRG